MQHFSPSNVPIEPDHYATLPADKTGTTNGVRWGLRPVTHDDAAWFVCGRRLIDGQPNPDYGCVFWEDVASGAVMFTFDREGWAHCVTYLAHHVPPKSGWIVKQGRLFRIAGPTKAQAARMKVAA